MGSIVSKVNDKTHLVGRKSTYYTGVLMVIILKALNSQGTDKQTESIRCLCFIFFFSPVQHPACVSLREQKTPPACRTHPFSIQQQVDFEDHAVVDGNFLISVKDLKYPAEDGAVVDPRRAEAAFLWWGIKRTVSLMRIKHDVKQTDFFNGFAQTHHHEWMRSGTSVCSSVTTCTRSSTHDALALLTSRSHDFVFSSHSCKLVILKAAAQKCPSLFCILHLNSLTVNDPSDPRFRQAFISLLLSSLGCPVSSWTGGSAAVQRWGMKGLWTPHWCSALFCVLPPISLQVCALTGASLLLPSWSSTAPEHDCSQV